jgi:hypothetical protein
MAKWLVEAGCGALKGGALSSGNYSFDPYDDDGSPRQTAANFAILP